MGEEMKKEKIPKVVVYCPFVLCVYNDPKCRCSSDKEIQIHFEGHCSNYEERIK